MVCPFKVISLVSNARFHPPLPRFYSPLAGFFFDAPQLRRYDLQEGRNDGTQPQGSLSSRLPKLKGSLQNGFPWAWGKEKSHTEQDHVNREVVPVRRCSSQPGTAGCSGCCEPVHCRGETATTLSCHNFLLFLRTEPSKHHRISL